MIMISFIYVNRIRNLTLLKGSKVRFIWNFFGCGAIFFVSWNWVLISPGNVHPSGELHINKSNTAGYILIFEICRANFLNPNWGLINDGIKSDFLRLSWKSFYQGTTLQTFQYKKETTFWGKQKSGKDFIAY